ncbi:MAG: DUF4364 family protein [Clostridia bacterium]|nr:DUF4364 family protein [Clostridia bacterium]MBR0406407.1 DUF4364 family protein [Clostridia bacterium]
MKIQPPRRAPDDEQRLMVLYSLSRLGPCTELQLLQFLFENDLMNYFDMMFALNGLCDRGQAVRTKKNAGFLYQATDAGEEALALFGGRVPKSLQTLLAETEGEWKARFRQETQTQQQIVQTDRGEYELHVKVVEREMDMMRLSLSLPTRELADSLAKRWPEKAGKVYDAVIRILTEDEP